MRQPARRQPPRPRAVLGRAGRAATRRAGRSGLYHLAWEVPTIEDLGDAARHSQRGRRARRGERPRRLEVALRPRPDGNEFEIMWRVPREAWGEYETKGVVMPLDIDAEVARFGVEELSRRPRRPHDRAHFWPNRSLENNSDGRTTRAPRYPINDEDLRTRSPASPDRFRRARKGRQDRGCVRYRSAQRRSECAKSE